MVGGGKGSLWTCFALLAVTSAGPLHRFPRESEDYQNDLSAYANYTANEVCFSEGEVFQKGDIMPNPGPCEECRCEPPSIVCNMLKCPTNNNGCRTIQRANHCCPDYNCECDYNGQLYNDGERLDLPEEPCQVCYCKGGEVMCNSITCYHRDDCDPIHVPGQCCPKYENCPVRDMGSSSSVDKNVLVRSANRTNNVPPKREMNPWLLTKLPPAPSSSQPKNSQDPTTEGGDVIIVSDWLTERRSTTENADVGKPNYSFDFTNEPELSTDSDRLTTDLRQDTSSDGSMVVRNSDVITPVDEVIFTRIDAVKRNKEVVVEEQSTISSIEAHNELGGFTSSECFTVPSVTETPIKIKDDSSDSKAINAASTHSDKHSVLEGRPSETSAGIQEVTELPVKIKESAMEDKIIISTEKPIQLKSSNTTSNENRSTTQPETTPVDPGFTEKKLSKNIQKVENTAKIDGKLVEELELETTTTHLIESQTTEIKASAAGINELNQNSLEDETKETLNINKDGLSVNKVKTPLNGGLDSTANSVTGPEITTPFIPEIKLEKDNLKKHDQTTDFQNTNSENGKLSTVLPELGSTGENLGSTGSLTREKDYPSENETKTKRNNLNTSFSQNVENNTLGSILANKPEIRSSVKSNETVAVSNENATSQIVKLNNTSSNENDDSAIYEGRDFALPTVVSSGIEPDDGMELSSDAPPVLELNSHVPFLQFGGHEITDSAMNTPAENFQTTVTYNKHAEIVDKGPVPNVNHNNSSVKQIDSSYDKPVIKTPEVEKEIESSIQKLKQYKKENDLVEVETTTSMVFPTSHIPLTPGDLKVLAEYLINDTIKTSPLKNNSDYISNPWLRGNLTSEEKMSSILAAANISIAVMNKTNDTSTQNPGEAIRLDKLDKDKRLSGNNALNDLKIANKSRFIQGKSDEYLDSPRINSESEKSLNIKNKEVLTTEITSNTESANNIKKSTLTSTAPNTSENVPLKYQSKKNMSLNNNHSQTSTEQSPKAQTVSPDSSNNDLRVDNVNPTFRNPESKQSIKNNLLVNDKLLDASVSTVQLQKSTIP